MPNYSNFYPLAQITFRYGMAARLGMLEMLLGIWMVMLLAFLTGSAGAFGDTLPANDYDVLSIDSSTKRISVVPYLKINDSLEKDLPTDLIVNNLNHAGWKQNTNQTISLGLTEMSSLWFMFTIDNQNTLQKRWYLEIPNPMLDHIKFYVIEDGKTVKFFEAGDNVPYERWPIKTTHPVIPLDLSPNKITTVMLEVQTKGTLNLPGILWEELAFYEHNDLSKIVNGLYFGIVFVMAFYNFFIYLSVRDNSYLYYVLFVVFMALYMGTARGIAPLYLWPDNTWLHANAGRMSITFAAAFCCFFVVSILSLKETLPKVGLFLTSCGFIYLFCLSSGLVLVASANSGIVIIGKFVFILHSLAGTFSIFAGIYLALKGSRIAVIFSAAWLIYFTGVVAASLNRIGILPSNFFTEYGVQFGTAIEVILFSLALADRINTMRDEKIAAFGQVALKNQQIEHILRATKELTKAKSKVEACRVAIQHMILVDDNIALESIACSLANKNRETFTGYQFWLDGQNVEHPLPYESDPIRGRYLSELNSIALIDNCLTVPIKSEKQYIGSIEIGGYRNTIIEAPHEESIVNVLEGISRSLALTLENIDSEENSRLSGIGAMAASIAHDLKNPLGAIMGYADMASDSKISSTERNDYLNVIQREAERMSSMAHEVLEFSRGEINLILATVHSETFILDVCKTLQVIFQMHNIEFHHAISYQGYIELDDNRLRRVLLNLATNAQEAMSGSAYNKEQSIEEDRQTIDPRFELTLARQENNIVISATDNGPGIPTQIRATLFEPFVTEGKANGTGLGMAIVKMIVQAHGGRIEFDTELGKGTTFRIILPQKPELLDGGIETLQQPTQNTPTQNSIAAHNKTYDLAHLSSRALLLAEDNPVNQQIFAKMLEQQGLVCDIVANGALAVERCKTSHYDLILMDCEMPIMNGFDAATAIRIWEANCDKAPVPIIALTGHSQTSVEDRYVKSGMSGYLQKPIKKNQLYQILLTWLDEPKS